MAKRKKSKGTNNDLQFITYKAKDRLTRTPQRAEGELRCSGRVGRSCTRRVTGKDGKVFMTSGTYPWSFVTQMCYYLVWPTFRHSITVQWLWNTSTF
jgi:hypothetical protein